MHRLCVIYTLQIVIHCWDHLQAIATLGNDLSYPLVKPILERCTAEQLFLLEESSPVRDS